MATSLSCRCRTRYANSRAMREACEALPRRAERERVASEPKGRSAMGPVRKGGVVAGTGAAGFIGGWVVRLLLDRGYRVRACVRNPADESRAGFLKAMPAYASGRLTLHAADLDEPGCFDAIFEGAHGVAHISHVSTYADMDYVAKVCGHV